MTKNSTQGIPCAPIGNIGKLRPFTDVCHHIWPETILQSTSIRTPCRLSEPNWA